MHCALADGHGDRHSCPRPVPVNRYGSPDLQGHPQAARSSPHRPCARPLCGPSPASERPAAPSRANILLTPGFKRRPRSAITRRTAACGRTAAHCPLREVHTLPISMPNLQIRPVRVSHERRKRSKPLPRDRLFPMSCRDQRDARICSAAHLSSTITRIVGLWAYEVRGLRTPRLW